MPNPVAATKYVAVGALVIAALTACIVGVGDRTENIWRIFCCAVTIGVGAVDMGIAICEHKELPLCRPGIEAQLCPAPMEQLNRMDAFLRNQMNANRRFQPRQANGPGFLIAQTRRGEVRIYR